jgi:outer membrane protein
MKRIIALIFAACSLAASAQTEEDVVPVQEPVIMIGYLSYDSALVAMEEYAIVRKQMADLRTAYENELQRVEEEFNQKYEAFLEGQKDFPRTILLKRQTELQEMMQRNIDFKKQGLIDIQNAEREAMQPLRERLNAAIAKVAAEQRLALVLNTDSNACPFIDPALGVDVAEAVMGVLKK